MWCKSTEILGKSNTILVFLRHRITKNNGEDSSQSVFMKRIISVIVLGTIVYVAAAQSYSPNRAPLCPNTYSELPIGAIKAEGWLYDQLLRQKDGLTGHLDELYGEVVGSNNAWIGGEGDTWERGPYWLDGLVPLAYLLEDEQLIAKSKVWTEAMLTMVYDDGYFGNRISRKYIEGFQRGKAEDWWPKMVALKVLKQYYMATFDQRVLDVMTGYFKYQLSHLPEKPLDYWTFWGKWRGGDNLDIVYWLYNITGEEFLLELGDLIHSQTTPWTAMFWAESNELLVQNSMHTVNLAHGFKEPIVWWQKSHDPKDLDAPKNALKLIRHGFGLPTGLWAGDEQVHFGDPTRGSELCTTVEAMYSFERMLQITGDPLWANQLERIAYNALPTQSTDAYDARQYYQQTNQIACTREWRNFVTQHEDNDNLFGVLNGYPCCSCNMHQGWPKFVQNLWYASTDGGLAALVYAPSSVTAQVADGTEVRLKQETDYPFNGTVRVSVDFTAKKTKSASFPLHFRIPEWCSNAKVLINGEQSESKPQAGKIICLSRNWHKGDVIELDFPMEVEISHWYDGATVVERGPLIYSLRMEEKWEKHEFEKYYEGKYGPYYYICTSDSEWRYGFRLQDMVPEKLNEIYNVELHKNTGLYPWTPESAPVSIHAKAVEIKHWNEYNGSTGPVAYFREDGDDTGEETWIELIPYGCTTLRITEFPTRL